MITFKQTLALSVAMFSMSLALPANAQPSDNELCFAGPVEDANLTACTRMINSKNLRGSNLTRVIGRRCLLYVRRGEVDSAYSACDEVLRRELNAAWAMALRGSILIRKGDLKRAEADINEAATLDPKAAGTHSALGLLHLAKGNPQRAVEEFDRAFAINPNNGYFLKNRGLAYEAKGDIDRAVTDLQNALRRDPDKKELLGRETAEALKRIANAYGERGDEFLANKDYDRAMADYSLAAKIAPQAAGGTLVSLGYALQMKGLYAQAVATFDAAIKLDPQSAYAFYNRGSAKLAAGDAAGGNADIAVAKKLDPKIGQ